MEYVLLAGMVNSWNGWGQKENYVFFGDVAELVVG